MNSDLYIKNHCGDKLKIMILKLIEKIYNLHYFSHVCAVICICLYNL